MDTKINVQGKVCTGNVLQPRCYKSYTDIASLSAVKLKQLCVQYNLDTTLPKKAKIVFLCQRLGISTTGNNLNVQKSKKSARTFDSLTSYQHEELEQLRSKIFRVDTNRPPLVLTSGFNRLKPSRSILPQVVNTGQLNFFSRFL